uniref:Coenzyme Q-binding protein COQ10 START domain-containing protein n=1 Tax=Pinguiococcus pyrenoidosus TaxID=172671 RepID=A0A7R9YDQ6_9STRA|mmetsp:Transcript_4159/g.16166  ORF Transcript_4159/g.16166 Transcript_4159/m.16166 type:complete len:299 (+) Transcript_4159:306-1202(+)
MGWRGTLTALLLVVQFSAESAALRLARPGLNGLAQSRLMQFRPQATREGMSMVGFFNRGRSSKDSEVVVTIERLASNIRRISGTCVVDSSVDDVWAILTDYDNLADHVPNLTQSRRLNHPQGGIRLFQEGAQKIVGFNFRASLTMDMTVKIDDDKADAARKRAIGFELVESQMFKDFSGEWRLEPFSRKKKRDPVSGNVIPGYTYSTMMFYTVTIKPRGVVPVGALEWRIKEDVPTNMLAVKKASEEKGELIRTRQEARLAAAELEEQMKPKRAAKSQWAFEADETLEAYMARARREQ